MKFFVILFLLLLSLNSNAQVADSICKIPLVLLPQSSSQNRIWQINCEMKVDSFQVRLFNRWGELVFTSKDQQFSWDGKNEKGKYVPEGVYVYTIDYFIFNKKVNKKGTLMIIL